MKITSEIAKIFEMPQQQKAETKPQEETTKATTNDVSSTVGQYPKILKKISDKLPTKLEHVAIELYEEGMPIDEETIEALSLFLGTFTGSPEEKIEVIKALLAKDLDINMENLELVYEALYGRDISEMIKNSLATLIGNESLSENQDIERILDRIKIMLQESLPLEKIADWIGDTIELTHLDPETEITLLKASNEARQAAKYDMEDMGIRILEKAIKDVSKEIKDEKVKTSKSLDDNYTKTELSSIAFPGKDYLVVEISKRLKEISQNFKDLRGRTINNIDRAIRFIQEGDSLSINNSKDTLERTIEILDKAILKSDITLFTDMGTEKNLIKASSQLAKAKEFISTGQYEKAEKLLLEVKDLLTKLDYKLEDIKIMHFAGTRNFKDGFNTDGDRFNGAIKHIKEPFIQGQASGRILYETMRQLGMEHEADIARYLSGEEIPRDDIENNMKSILLRLVGDKSGQVANNSELSDLADKITGQQLMSRWDKGETQTIFSSLPLPIGGELKDVKFYINSRKEKEKMDWKNCSIYFLIETKKLGETGILLQSTGRNLSITVKNDKKDIEEKAEPLMEGFKEGLLELGYEIGKISFDSFTTRDNTKSNHNRAISNRNNMRNVNSISKGFDARI